MPCIRMRENGEFVQVAVKGALRQLAQKVVEKFLVTAVYLFKDDRAFSLLCQDFSQILVLCLP